MGLHIVFLILAVSYARRTGLTADAVTHWQLSDEGVPVPLATEQAADRLIHDTIMSTVVRSVGMQQQHVARRGDEVAENRTDESSAHERNEKGAEWRSESARVQEESEAYGVCLRGEEHTVTQERCSAAVSHDKCAHNQITREQLPSRAPKELVTKEVISPLSCHLPAVVTQYDYLPGLKNRKKHPMYPEPDVAMIFRASAASSLHDVDMDEVEKELISTVLRKQLGETDYNRLGNFWRVRGDTHEAIDCYRQGLSRSADHPDLLLNLARVLVNLEYWDDAKELVMRSLQVKSPEHNSWLEQYTLGEISKEIGSLEDAIIHFRQALDLNPNFEMTQCHLQELEGDSQSIGTMLYTLIILMLLTAGVFCLLLWLLGDDDDEGQTETPNYQQVKHRDKYSRMSNTRTGKAKHKSKG